jgi:hypothetical protein
MKIGFLTHGLTLRGAEVATLDYALAARSVLGMESFLLVRKTEETEASSVYGRWKEMLPCLLYSNRTDLQRVLAKHRIGILYQIKPGRDDGWVVPGIRNCIHAMFPSTEFHGDVYLYVSRWLSREMTGREDRFVPHLVEKVSAKGNLRKELGISETARVFGRHGGSDTFDIPFVQRLVRAHARTHPRDHFIFLNTREFLPSGDCPANVHFLPGTADPGRKAVFLESCDAMLHARRSGETFGLAVGEFAVRGKPVITYGGSRERAHLEMLGAEAVVYENERGLEEILCGFALRAGGAGEYGLYQDPYYVMKLFAQRFLAE